MMRLIRWAAKLYPPRWRARYGRELDALLDDVGLSWRDLPDTLWGALVAQVKTLSEDRVRVIVQPSGAVVALHDRPVVLAALTAYAIAFAALALAAQLYVRPTLLIAPAPPSPPAPPQLVEMTDPRVFARAYSSLPISSSGGEHAVATAVVHGVGIRFLTLPDMGLTDRLRNPLRRVWPGQPLETEINRRVIPKYPRGAPADSGAVSVFLEYVIGTDGAVRVLRSSGPALFDKAARSALEYWTYRPIRFEGQVIEVVSRVEVKFDAGLAKGSG